MLFNQATLDVIGKVHDARERGISAPALAVLDAMQSTDCYGAEHARSIAWMQQQWRKYSQRVWSDRVVKAAVKELIEEQEVPLGSCRRSDCPGYFFIVTDEDRTKARQPILAELRSLAKRLKATDPTSQLARELCGQLETGV